MEPSVKGGKWKGLSPVTSLTQNVVWHLEVHIVDCSSYQGLPSGSSPICGTSSAAKRWVWACLSDEQQSWLVGGRDSQRRGEQGRSHVLANQKETDDNFPTPPAPRAFKFWEYLPLRMFRTARGVCWWFERSCGLVVTSTVTSLGAASPLVISPQPQSPVRQRGRHRMATLQDGDKVSEMTPLTGKAQRLAQ